MVRKGRKPQDEQTKLILADRKFEPSKQCELCGEPTLTNSVRCLPCLQAIYLREELAYTREMRPRSLTLIQLAHDPSGVVHLVLARSKTLSWCGTKVTQRQDKRPWALHGEFPPALCPQCLSAYEGMKT